MKKYHLVATIDVLRHGEKNESGELTANGFQQAAIKALTKEHLKEKVHVFHSGNTRVMKTVSAMHNFISKDVNYLQSPKFIEEIYNHFHGKNNVFKIDSKALPELHYLFNPKIKGKYFSSWNKTLNHDKSCQRMQDFLNFREISPEPQIIPSPKQMAQRVLKIVLDQIRSVINTKYNSRENFINGTHEPVLMSAIFYMLNYLKAGKNDFVKHIGGSVDFTEGFHIKIYQERNDEFVLQFFFRNYMINFSVEELEKFVNEK